MGINNLQGDFFCFNGELGVAGDIGDVDLEWQWDLGCINGTDLKALRNLAGVDSTGHCSLFNGCLHRK